MSTVVTTTPSVEIAQLARDLRALGGETSRNLNKEFKTGVTEVANAAKANASWSSRIPAAIKVQTARSLVHPGADIVVSGLPHPRLYEGLTKGGRRKFRHPVFGNTHAWVSQSTRPFIRPAEKEKAEGLKKHVDAAVIAAARAQGWT